MNDKSTQLKHDVSKNKGLSHVFGWLVVGGLAIEVILAFEFPKSTAWETWSSIFADVLVVLGVWGEIHFAGRASKSEEDLQRISDEKIAEANEVAAKANERAAILEKEAAEARKRTAEIERLTAWRRIPEEEKRQIEDAIRVIAPSLDVLVEYERGDSEAFRYAWEFLGIFANAGAKQIREGPNSFMQTAFGVYIANAPELDETPVVNAFENAKISPCKININLSTHLPQQLPAPNLYIFVAAKPPPNMLEEK